MERTTTNYQIKEVRAEATYVCNQKCLHCYALDGTPNQHGLPEVFAPEDGALVKWLTKLRADHGTERLSLTGGEVLLPSFLDNTLGLVKQARSLDMKIRIMTNGTTLTDRVLERLTEAAGDPRAVTLQISIDSADPAVHDAFRGAPGSLNKTIDGVRRAVAAGFIVHIRYSIREGEADDVVGGYRLACELGAHSFIVKPVFETGRARTNVQFVAGQNTVRDAQLQLAEASCDGTTPVKLAQPIYITHADLPPGANIQFTECNCGKSGVTIDQYGNAIPCNYISGTDSRADFTLGNILDPAFDLAQAWNKEDTFVWYRNRDTSVGTCPSDGVLQGCCLGDDD